MARNKKRLEDFLSANKARNIDFNQSKVKPGPPTASELNRPLIGAMNAISDVLETTDAFGEISVQGLSKTTIFAALFDHPAKIYDAYTEGYPVGDCSQLILPSVEYMYGATNIAPPLGNEVLARNILADIIGFDSTLTVDVGAALSVRGAVGTAFNYTAWGLQLSASKIDASHPLTVEVWNGLNVLGYIQTKQSWSVSGYQYIDNAINVHILLPAPAGVKVQTFVSFYDATDTCVDVVAGVGLNESCRLAERTTAPPPAKATSFRVGVAITNSDALAINRSHPGIKIVLNNWVIQKYANLADSSAYQLAYYGNVPAAKIVEFKDILRFKSVVPVDNGTALVRIIMPVEVTTTLPGGVNIPILTLLGSVGSVTLYIQRQGSTNQGVIYLYESIGNKLTKGDTFNLDDLGGLTWGVAHIKWDAQVSQVDAGITMNNVVYAATAPYANQDYSKLIGIRVGAAAADTLNAKPFYYTQLMVVDDWLSDAALQAMYSIISTPLRLTGHKGFVHSSVFSQAPDGSFPSNLVYDPNGRLGPDNCWSGCPAEFRIANNAQEGMAGGLTVFKKDTSAYRGVFTITNKRITTGQDVDVHAKASHVYVSGMASTNYKLGTYKELLMGYAVKFDNQPNVTLYLRVVHGDSFVNEIEGVLRIPAGAKTMRIGVAAFLDVPAGTAVGGFCWEGSQIRFLTEPYTAAIPFTEDGTAGFSVYQ